MDFVKHIHSGREAREALRRAASDFVLLLPSRLLGCADQGRPPTQGQLDSFQEAGCVEPTVDMDRVKGAEFRGGLYRIVPGEPAAAAATTTLQPDEPKPLQRALVSARSPNPNKKYRAGDSRKEPAFVLPVVAVNTPFQDIAFEEGDTVVVEQIPAPPFSVLGLVRDPGNFEYPQNTEYNQAQAIACEGGLDSAAERRHAAIYGLRSGGSVARAPLGLIEKNELRDTLSVPTRPGDALAAEHTPQTGTCRHISNLMPVNMSAYILADDRCGLLGWNKAGVNLRMKRVRR